MTTSSYSDARIASLYDALYASEDHVGIGKHEAFPDDALFYMDLLGATPKHVLELGCGTGRVSIPLAISGHGLTGLDASREMLEIARDKASRLTGEVRDRLTWVESDWGDYDLGTATFDAAICPFSSFLMNVTIPEQDRFLDRVRTHLKPGGLLAIDMFFPDMSRLAQPEEPRHLKRTFVAGGVEWTEHERIVRQAAPQRFECVLDYQRADGTGEVVDQRFELTWFFPRELERMVVANGFELIGVVDPATGDELTVASKRQMVLARRS